MRIKDGIIFLIMSVSTFSAKAETASTPNKQDNTAKKFDSSSLQVTPSDKKPEELKISNPKKKKEALVSSELSQEDPTKLDKQIKAVQLILKNEKDRNKKINLYLRLSYLHVSIAKKYGVLRNQNNSADNNESKHLAEAEKILNFLLKNLENNKRMLSTLYNIKGLVAYEMDKPDLTVENFLKAIQLYPENPQVDVMSIFIGEYYFDLEKYDEAIKYYQMFYKRLNPSQKALSDYKVAWSLLNKKEIEKAENQFIKIIRDNLDKGIVDDSYKDIAFLLTQNKDESVLINKVNGFLTSPILKGKLYYFCLLFYLQNTKGEPKDQIFKEVLSIQKDPYEVLKLLALKISFEKKDIPTQGMVQAVFNLDTKIKKTKKEIREEFFKKDSFQLEEDSEFNIRAHVDAYAGRLKTEQVLTKQQIGDLSVKLIETHLNWFENSKKKSVLTNLWVDICVDQKNTKCLFDLETKFKAHQKDNDAKEFLKKIQIEILALYDDAYEKDKEKHRAAFIARLKQYTTSFPNDPISAKSQKRLFGILFETKQYVEALPLGEKILETEKSNENAHKVLLTLFELGKYSEILNNQAYLKYTSPEIVEVRRESSLKSAMMNSNQGNFKEYEADIKSYLATNPSVEKATVVHLDYLKKLIELDKLDVMKQEWTKLPNEIKSRPGFANIRALFFDKVINSASLIDIPAFWVYGDDKETNYQVLLNKVWNNQTMSSEDFKVLDSQALDKKIYLLNVLNFTHSDLVWGHLNTKKKLADEEKRLAFAAALRTGKSLNPKFKDEQIVNFKELVPDRYFVDKELSVEKSFKNVVFPNSKMKPKTYESYVVNNVDNIKYLRNRVVKVLGTATTTQKIRLLEQMIIIEKKMGDSIIQSPAPDGLAPEQLAEYKTGLETMAKDYFGQAETLDKAKQELVTKQNEELENEKKDLLPAKTFDTWPVNQNDNFVKVKAIFEKNGIKAAIIYLDNQVQKKSIQNEEYFDLKTWVFLKTNPSDIDRKLYRLEIQSAGQNRIIEKWVGKP